MSKNEERENFGASNDSSLRRLSQSPNSRSTSGFSYEEHYADLDELLAGTGAWSKISSSYKEEGDDINLDAHGSKYIRRDSKSIVRERHTDKKPLERFVAQQDEILPSRFYEGSSYSSSKTAKKTGKKTHYSASETRFGASNDAKSSTFKKSSSHSQGDRD